MMSNRIKLMIVAGTRPELIRLARVIERARQEFEVCLVHTGQNYDPTLRDAFFHDLRLSQPEVQLPAKIGLSAAAAAGKMIAEVDAVIAERKPDAFLVLGDTNSALTAYAAKRHGVPVFHMEAGNRCFDSRVPEETNRRIVDHLSDINLPYSQIAREYLLREGIPPQRVVVTGSPLCEVLGHYLPAIEKSDVLQRLSLKKKEYLLVSLHREENVDRPERLAALLEGVQGVRADCGGIRVLISTHPRTAKRLDGVSEKLKEGLEFSAPFGFHDYNHLQLHAKLVLSDSGSINEESVILGFPALNLRESFERPEAMEEGAVILTGLDPLVIRSAAKATISREARGERRNRVRDYSVSNVSEKVACIILSYFHSVRRSNAAGGW